MTPEERAKFGQEIYRDVCQSLTQAGIENQKAFDQAILALSTGAIGLLLNFVHGAEAVNNQILLFVAIGMFLISLASTVVSFLAAQSAIKEQSGRALKYYMGKQTEGFNDESCAEKAVKALNITAGAAFLLGTFFAILFVASNMR